MQITKFYQSNFTIAMDGWIDSRVSEQAFRRFCKAPPTTVDGHCHISIDPALIELYTARIHCL